MAGFRPSSRKNITRSHPRLRRKICCARRAGKSGLRAPASRRSIFSTLTATSCAACSPVARPGLNRDGPAITRSSTHSAAAGLISESSAAPSAPRYAVLIAEEMFASGCKLLISVTSSGQIVPIRPPPYFIIIERALRDEGTSYHYMAASDYSDADAGLIVGARRRIRRISRAGADGRDLDHRCAVP